MQRLKDAHEWMKARSPAFGIGIIAGIGVEKFDLITRWF